jgi:hypothetical protein
MPAPRITYRTTRRIGDLPKGMRVEVISLSLAGGTGAGNRDGGGGDGQWILVRYPDSSLQHAMVRSLGELAELGIHPEDLEEES